MVDRQRIFQAVDVDADIPVEQLPQAELQLLLERVFENSRRLREDREYEEFLADLRREGERSVNADIEMELDDLERTQGS